MITEQAVVRHCRGGFVEVELQRQSSCAQCELSQGCGVGAIGRLLGHRLRPLVVATDASLAPGDRVEIGLPESVLVKTSLLVYGSPLLGLLAGGFIAAGISLPDTGIGLFSLAGFIGGYFFARRLSAGLVSAQITPHILSIEVNPDRRSGS